MSYTFELNNERKDANFVSGKVKANSPVVEIFSAMAQGKDLAPYGKKADVAAKYIMELNAKGDFGTLYQKCMLQKNIKGRWLYVS